MIDWRLVGLVGALLIVVAPAKAAPAEQADCPYDSLAEADRALVGEVLFTQMDEGGPKLPPATVNKAQTALEIAMGQCVAKHGWSEDEASSAFSYASTRMLSDVARRYMDQLGGDSNVADLFFAQNKYRILEEDAAGNSSEEWANTRLVEMGYAPAKSRAFDAVWLYLGLLFQIDAQREAFVSGKKPDWTK
jgi:hypothetical protein